MKGKDTNNRRLALTIALALLGAASLARAGSASHYNGGVMNIRDYLVPDPGVYAIVYNYYYTSDRLNDQHGNQIKSVTVNPGPGPGITLNVSPDINLYALAPALIWITPWNLGGIKYGAFVNPTWANASIDATITSERGRGINPGTSTFDTGDMLVEPVWLGYTLTNWDFALGYGFYAPIGRYNTETATITGPRGQSFTGTFISPKNIGLGFWTHQIQAATAWYPWADKRMAVVVALTYEINTRKDDIDVTPGDHLTLNWGISQYLPLTKDHSLLVEIGPAGYDNWQITDDSGSAANNPTVHQQVHGVGGQFGLTYVPWQTALNFHAFYEFSATERLQGEAYGISISKKF